MSETIVADPAEFIANRTELGLDEIGLSVRGDPDWGDSEVELFLVRQALGEIPADRHPPNRSVQIPLMASEEGPVSLAEAAAKLQQKVGVWQREGGFVRRDFDPGGQFATSVAMQVYGATLGGLDGWLMAHRQKAQDITLNLVTGPYVYGTTPIESSIFKASASAYLKWELAQVSGSAPGLIRVSVKNEGGTHWRGLLAGIESRFLAQSASKETTANCVYECEALTLSGGSIVEVAETSSGKAVKNTALTAGFLTILSSKVVASGHMTHTGSRRVWMRVKDLGGEATNVELKLVWRALSSAKWTENRAVAVPLVGGWAQIDLGEVLPEAAVLGEQRWEWHLLARGKSGSGEVELDVLFLLPNEQMLVLATPPVTLQPDAVSTKSPGSGESVALGEGKVWTNPNNVKASDNVYATSELGFVEPENESRNLRTKSHGFALPAEASVTGIVVEIERKSNILTTLIDNFVGVNGGTIVNTFDYSEQAKRSLFWPIVDTYATYGSSSFLWGQTWTVAQINSENFGVTLQVANHAPGKVTASVDHIKITVYYSTAPDENRVCFATRSLEMRADGVYRQHLTDNVWGRGVPDGFLPYAPPSGLEGRAARGLIVPSVGDHLEQPDTGMKSLSAQVIYFPGYHFTSEAE